MAIHIIILGAGIAGLSSALALRKYLPDPKPSISIFEIRPTPSSIGGAVNLTPKALRYLDHLGAYQIMLAEGAGAEVQAVELFNFYSGDKIGEMEFRGPDGKGVGKPGSQYYSMRTMRSEIQSALLKLVEAQEGTDVVFGKKVVQITESADGVKLVFEDGKEVSGDVLLGCDGIHSAARQLLVDPSRKQSYTGVAVTMGRAEVRSQDQIKWKTTGIVSSRGGSLLGSYYEPSRKYHYIATVRQTEEVSNKEGWRVRGSDREAVRNGVLEQFGSCQVKVVKELIESVPLDSWTLYPVYKLPPRGRWISPGKRCILLGDSAHAMPPQGESTGICIEDAIVFARAMMHHQAASIPDIFNSYERIRRELVESAYNDAVWRWENVKDQGWLAFKILMSFTSWFLWWTAKVRNKDFAEDLTELDVEV